MARIFISYKRQDRNIVFPIVDEIKQKTGVDCWIDLEGVESGDLFQNVIIDAIDNADIVIFMLSKNFIAPYRDEITGEVNLKKQTFPEKEVMYALRHNKRLIPISIDGTAVYDCRWLEFNCSGLDCINWKIEEQKAKLLNNLWKWTVLQEDGDQGQRFFAKNATEKWITKVICNMGRYSMTLFSYMSAILIFFLFTYLFFYEGSRASTFNARLLENSSDHIIKDTFFIPSVVAMLSVIYFYFFKTSKSTKDDAVSFSSWCRTMANAIAIDFVIYLISHTRFMISSELFIKGLIYTILTVIFYFIYSVLLKFNSKKAKHIPF